METFTLGRGEPYLEVKFAKVADPRSTLQDIKYMDVLVSMNWFGVDWERIDEGQNIDPHYFRDSVKRVAEELVSGKAYDDCMSNKVYNYLILFSGKKP
jgi:hypothetical protein